MMPSNPLYTLSGWLLAFRLAWRESKSGFSGFRVFIAVIALGVATIATVGSVSDGLVRGINAEGKVLLGGDLSIRTELLPIDEAELDELRKLGKISTIKSFRTLARPAKKPEEGVYVRIKATDLAYPLIGTLGLEPSLPLRDVYALQNAAYGVAIDPLMALQYDLGIGDEIMIGQAAFTVRALIEREPDRVISALNISQPVLMSHEGLKATGLIRPGSLISYFYRLALPKTTTDEGVTAIADSLKPKAFELGWGIRTRVNGFRNTRGNIERFGQFITLVGLATLIVGGVGVFNAIQVFVARKARNVAVLNALGAEGGLIVAVYLIQVMLLTTLAIILGVAVGYAVTTLGGPAIALGLGVKSPINLSLAPSFEAAAYGYLIAFGFTFPPLSRMSRIKPSALLRDRVAPAGGLPSLSALIMSGCAFALLAFIALITASDPRISLYVLGGTFITFIILLGLSKALIVGMARLPRLKTPLLRYAFTNIHRPDSMTSSVILSVGIGMTLLVVMAEIEGNLRLRLTDAIPDNAPSFFFQNIDNEQSDAFDKTLNTVAPAGVIETVPMLRGRIISLGDTVLNDDTVPLDIAWIKGDRGVTYASEVPENVAIVAGEWWPKDYDGPPLVSLTDDVVTAFNLSLGDEVAVNVLGRTIKAKLANVRKVVWESMAINFALNFSPNTFAGAPHTMLKTITLPEGVGHNSEVDILKAIVRHYPEVTPLRVKEVLATALGVVERLGLAIRIAALVSIVASILVLGGALAASTERRIYEAVILKTLGAERSWLMKSFIIEFALLGLSVSLFACIAGTLGAYFLLTEVLRQGFIFVGTPVLITLASTILLIILLGFSSAYKALSTAPAQKLRTI